MLLWFGVGTPPRCARRTARDIRLDPLDLGSASLDLSSAAGWEWSSGTNELRALTPAGVRYARQIATLGSMRSRTR
jgi:hypothetical protein